jgi:hypothetical protein
VSRSAAAAERETQSDRNSCRQPRVKTRQTLTEIPQGAPMRISAFILSTVSLALSAQVSQAAESPQEKQAILTALQAFNDFIGDWSGKGEAKSGKSEFWDETMSWNWKFNKDAAPNLTVKFKNNKQFTYAEVKFVPDKKVYQLIVPAREKSEKDLVFEGKIVRRVLEMTRSDDASKDRYTIRMSSTNEGALFNLEYLVQTGGKGIDKSLFVVRSKKEGVSISGGKKNECVVSGGVGTIAVSYNGKTYYVCCGGCRDAFNESEAAKKKFVEDFEKKNKK